MGYKQIEFDIEIVRFYNGPVIGLIREAEHLIDENVKANREQFGKLWQKVTMIYSDYARSQGINYTTLQVLKYISEIPNCTQKIICEQSLLPKQTVNTIVTHFYKDGYVELRELPDDRRVKSIHLTKKGKAYADEITERLYRAEYQAMANLSSESRQALIESFRQYATLFQQALTQNHDL